MLETPALLAHSADLELVIRHVLAGLGHGIHAGRERGAGVEFSEYRAYAPGDEWRRVDWKLLARADRYYVREAERDSHVATWLVLDATASMAEPSRRVDGLSKHWYARTALACVAAIAQRQGDAFGLLVLSNGKVEFTQASRGPRETSVEAVKKHVGWGAGPRAGQALVLASKARALMQGRLAVTREDIGHMLLPVLAHRVLRNFEAEADGIAIADILAALRNAIKPE